MLDLDNAAASKMMTTMMTTMFTIAMTITTTRTSRFATAKYYVQPAEGNGTAQDLSSSNT